MRSWWNWQTRQLEGLVLTYTGMGVRIPPDAPEKQHGGVVEQADTVDSKSIADKA